MLPGARATHDVTIKIINVADTGDYRLCRAWRADDTNSIYASIFLFMQVPMDD